jgi:hypothetical protein
MNLTQLAAKPQLIKMTLDDETIVSKYGEPLDFWIYDRQPIEQFIKIATMKDQNYDDMIHIIKDMILNEAGEPVIQPGTNLPTDVFTKVIAKVVESLGK